MIKVDEKVNLKIVKFRLILILSHRAFVGCLFGKRAVKMSYPFQHDAHLKINKIRNKIRYHGN